MSNFKVANGHVRITDEHIEIERSPITGLTRHYQKRKRFTAALLLIWVACIIIVFTNNTFGAWMRYTVALLTLIIPTLSIFTRVRERTIGGTVTKIPKASIIRVEHDDPPRFKLARIKVIYTKNKEEKSHNVWIRFLSVVNGGQIEDAITTLESEGITTKEGKYSKEAREHRESKQTD